MYSFSNICLSIPQQILKGVFFSKQAVKSIQMCLDIFKAYF